MQNKIKTLIKDTFIFAIGSFGSKLILFLLVPLYTNYLSKEQYGTADLVITVSQLIIPVISIDIFSAVIRFGLEKDQKKEDVLLNSFLILAFSCAMSIVLQPLFSIIQPIKQWRRYLSIYSIAMVGMSIEMNYLKVKDKNKLFALMSLLQALFLGALNYLFLTKWNLNIQGYLLSNCISCVLIFVILLIFGGIIKDLRKGHYNKELLRKMLVFSAPLIINDISWWGIHSTDKMMIEGMINLSELGLYTLASKIPSLMNVLITIFTQAWGLSSIREIETSRNTRFFSTIFSAFSMLAFGAAILINCFIKPFMSIYVAEEYQEAWKLVPILLVSASFSAVAAYYGSVYSAIKKTMGCMWTTIIAGVLNVALNYIFIRQYGVWGALIGTVVSYIVLAVARMINIRKHIIIQTDYVRFSLNSALAIIHAIFIIRDDKPFIISVITLLVFLIVNFPSLKRVIQHNHTKEPNT